VKKGEKIVRRDEHPQSPCPPMAATANSQPRDDCSGNADQAPGHIQQRGLFRRVSKVSNECGRVRNSHPSGARQLHHVSPVPQAISPSILFHFFKFSLYLPLKEKKLTNGTVIQTNQTCISLNASQISPTLTLRFSTPV